MRRPRLDTCIRLLTNNDAPCAATATMSHEPEFIALAFVVEASFDVAHEWRTSLISHYCTALLRRLNDPNTVVRAPPPAATATNDTCVKSFHSMTQKRIIEEGTDYM